jgi:uncharacterized protein (TIGR03437 family)
MSYRPVLPIIAVFLTTFTTQGASVKTLAPLPQPALSIDENRGQANPNIPFVVSSTQGSRGIQRNGVQYSPYQYSLFLVGANAVAVATASKPLPGRANYYSRDDPAKQVSGINRYSEVTFHEVYPGVDATYAVYENDIVLRLRCAAPSSLVSVVLEVPRATSLTVSEEGKLLFQDRLVEYAPPTVITDQPFYTIPPSAGYRIIGSNRFAIDLSGQVLSSSFTLEIKLGIGPEWGFGDYTLTDDSDNSYVVRTFSDFPEGGPTCDARSDSYRPCSDIAVYKFLPSGQLAYVTYVHGSYDRPYWIPKLSNSGRLLIHGETARPDQAMVDPMESRDVYALYLDTATGQVLASTVCGIAHGYYGPAAVIGADDSVYITFADGDVVNGYHDTVVHLDSTLSRVIYRTRLPGYANATALHPDGSLYVGGSYDSEQGNGPLIGRLSPSGDLQEPPNRLAPGLAGAVSQLAIAPDGRVWVAAYTAPTPAATDYRLMCLNSVLDKMLFSMPVRANELQIDRGGNVLLTTWGSVPVSENALVGEPCDSALLRLDPNGKTLYSTYLPLRWTLSAPGAEERLIFSDGINRFQLDTEGEPVPFAGCVANSASHFAQNVVAPGEIISVYGSMLGPEQSATAPFSSGHLPDALAGTQVLLDGVPIPLMYASRTRIDAVIPFDVRTGSALLLQVMTSTGITPPVTVSAATIEIGIFTVDGSGNGQAAALNEDGTPNSPDHPAKLGSVVTLFGTGGGLNETPLTAGAITPGKANPLTSRGVFAELATGPLMDVEYIGSAPGQPAGVVQINVRLPETMYFWEFPRSATPIGIGIEIPVILRWPTIAIE